MAESNSAALDPYLEGAGRFYSPQRKPDPQGQVRVQWLYWERLRAVLAYWSTYDL